MARKLGDKNFSLRERRLKAENELLKSELTTEKMRTKTREAELAEVKHRLRRAR